MGIRQKSPDGLQSTLLTALPVSKQISKYLCVLVYLGSTRTVGARSNLPNNRAG